MARHAHPRTGSRDVTFYARPRRHDGLELVALLGLFAAIGFLLLPHHRAVNTPARPSSPLKVVSHPVHRSHIRAHSGGPGRRERTLGNQHTTRLRARLDDRHLALRSAVASTRRDRDAGVALESVRVVSRQSRLLVRRLELVRDPAGEPVSGGVAWSARVDVAGSGGMADRLRAVALRVAVGRAGVPARARLVLSQVAQSQGGLSS